MSEQFFKVPVERLLDKIVVGEHRGIKFIESQWAMVSGLEESRFWVHISARRTGKSLSASILALHRCWIWIAVSVALSGIVPMQPQRKRWQIWPFM